MKKEEIAENWRESSKFGPIMTNLFRVRPWLFDEEEFRNRNFESGVFSICACRVIRIVSSGICIWMFPLTHSDGVLVICICLLSILSFLSKVFS
jgi:hypothetical protein